jgi:hypothetical protein
MPLPLIGVFVLVYTQGFRGLEERAKNCDTVKFGGGSLMVWGCMLWEGPGYATRIEGKMDAELYTSILEDELQQTMEYYGLEVEDVIFQQDNDSKNTSKKARMSQLWQGCATKQTNLNKSHLLVEGRRGGSSLSDAEGLGCWDSPESK